MSVWQTYRSQYARCNSTMPLLRRALMMHVVPRRELRRVKHATFEQLSSAGYDVETYDDGALPLDLKKCCRGTPPKNWIIPQSVLSPKIAKLKDAVLYMDGSALLPDGRYCFSDIHCIDEQRWRELQPDTYKMLRIVDPVTDHALIRRRNLHSPIRIPGRCFSTRHGNELVNFGHFVHDVLSRIYYEDLGAIVPGRDKVIAPPLLRPMERTLFQMVFEDYDIVNVPYNVPLSVEELLLPANLCNIQSFNSAAFAALAERMRRLMAPYAGKDRHKICISRRDGQRDNLGRDFANAEEYETRLRELGYVPAVVSELDAKDQFALFANTTDFVGIHGAGMMNMIMMPAEGKYTEIAGTSGSNLHSPCPNTTIRCALAAGHQVCGVSTAMTHLRFGQLAKNGAAEFSDTPAVDNPQRRPIIDIDQLERMLSSVSS